MAIYNKEEKYCFELEKIDKVNKKLFIVPVLRDFLIITSLGF